MTLKIEEILEYQRKYPKCNCKLCKLLKAGENVNG